jgi:hypothetical protein
MTRAELLRLFVLNAMCDDYEELEMIYDVVLRDTERCGMPASQSEILRALTEVVETGLAKAYRLRGEPLGELPGLPPLEEMEMPHRIYYYLTPNGKEVQQSEVD